MNKAKISHPYQMFSKGPAKLQVSYCLNTCVRTLQKIPL